jgi:hypothetical protein
MTQLAIPQMGEVFRRARVALRPIVQTRQLPAVM